MCAHKYTHHAGVCTTKVACSKNVLVEIYSGENFASSSYFPLPPGTAFAEIQEKRNQKEVGVGNASILSIIPSTTFLIPTVDGNQ